MESKIVKLKSERDHFVGEYIDETMKNINERIVDKNSSGKVELTYNFYEHNIYNSKHALIKIDNKFLEKVKEEVMERLKHEGIYSYVTNDGKLYIYWECVTYKENRKKCLCRKYRWLLWLLTILAIIAIAVFIFGFTNVLKFIGVVIAIIALVFFLGVIAS